MCLCVGETETECKNLFSFIPNVFRLFNNKAINIISQLLLSDLLRYSEMKASLILAYISFLILRIA